MATDMKPEGNDHRLHPARRARLRASSTSFQPPLLGRAPGGLAIKGWAGWQKPAIPWSPTVAVQPPGRPERTASPVRLPSFPRLPALCLPLHSQNQASPPEAEQPGSPGPLHSLRKEGQIVQGLVRAPWLGSSLTLQNTNG